MTTRLTGIADFQNFIDKELQADLLTLFMDKKSLLDRFFPRDWAGCFVNKCQASVLVMR
ncbi:MAG: hypothetical protein WC600_04615 [Desulfobaccales bacterium]